MKNHELYTLVKRNLESKEVKMSVFTIVSNFTQLPKIFSRFLLT